MARKRAALFEPPTQQQAEQDPTAVLKGPKGNYMWRCTYCKRPASSLSVAGKYVCKSHGGATAKQRDPVEKVKAVMEDRPAPRPPGRPITTGLYTKRPGVRVDELVREYQDRQLDPDATDEDMLYLRAYLDELKDRRPEVEALRDPLEGVLSALEELLPSIVPDENVSVDTIIDMLERGSEVKQLVMALSRLLKQVTGYTKDLENRHKALIMMSKARSETRLKDAAGRQLDIFTTISRRFMDILREQLSEADLSALEKRIEHDLTEVPLGLIDGSGSVRA